MIGLLLKNSGLLRTKITLLPFVALWLVLFFSTSAAFAKPEISVVNLHTQAVLQARQGEYLPAIKTLKMLYQQHPQNDSLLYDLVVVLFWAGKETEAIQYFTRINSYQAPNRVLELMAKMARNAKQFRMALRYYQQLLDRDNTLKSARLGFAMTLAETGKAREARLDLQQYLRENQDNQDILLALIYISELEGDIVWQAEYLRQLQILNPQDRKITRRYLSVLGSLGAHHLALAIADAIPDLLNVIERARLMADVAATEIRWGELRALSLDQRYFDTDRSLEDLDKACQCEWAKLDLQDGLNRRLVYDLMIALRDRKYMEEVIIHYHQILSAGIHIPDYVLLASGDAHLYLRQPEIALSLYQQVLQANPDNYNARLSSFYALVEMDRYHQAQSSIEQLAEEQPVWRSRWGIRSIKNNPRKFSTDLTSAMGLAYADNLSGAANRLQQMQELAPVNTEISKELATVWRWRGWSEKAMQRYQQILEMEPEFIGAEIGLVATHMDLRNYPESESGIKSLLEHYPEDLHAQKLSRNWILHNKPELRLQSRVGDSSGGTNGSHDIVADGWLYSAPIEHNYRLFLHNHYSEAAFSEGFGQNQRPGIGLEYRDMRWLATAELNDGLENNPDTGLALTAKYKRDDHWSFNGALEWNSMQMPLRGQRTGIQGNRVSAGTGYRWHESQSLSIAYNLVDMDDGNLRQSVSGIFEKRLINMPAYKLTGRVGVYASDNTEQGVIYYNPDSDVAVSVTLDNRWRLYRRYEKEFSHRLQLSMGRYWQEHVGTNANWSISYEHIWSLNDRVQLVYGFSRSQRVYDGTPEFQKDYYGNLNIRF